MAEVLHKVTFAPNNQCSDLFKMPYKTNNKDGLIRADPSHKNLATAEDLHDYEEHGLNYVFLFAPNAGETYTAQFEIYGGFDKGNRNIHMHFNKNKKVMRHYREWIMRLDLSEYLLQGFKILMMPSLRYHTEEPETCEQCKKLKPGKHIPYFAQDLAGIWEWRLNKYEPRSHDSTVGPRKSMKEQTPRNDTIELQEGQAALFGYGSLLSINSLERTLGHPYTGPFHVCWLEGWRRSWDIVMPNLKTFFVRTAPEAMYPENIVYLNIRPWPGHRVIGVVFIVSDKELSAFDTREWIYNREEVTDRLSGVTITGGPAFVYVGKPEYRLKTPSLPTYAAVRATYLDIIESGLRNLGEKFRAEYESSSDEVPNELVIQDHRN